MRSAQASVEFMTSYLWVGIAILIAVGVLSYYGSTIRTAYDKTGCNTGDQLRCIDAAAFEDGTFVFKFGNNLGHDLAIRRLELTNLNPPVVLDNIDRVVDVGEQPNIIINVNHNLSVGDVEDVELVLSYQTVEGGPIFSISGDAKIEVIAGPNPNINPFCGDGHLHPPTEQCDPGIPNGCTAPRYCSLSCTCVTPTGGGRGHWTLM